MYRRFLHGQNFRRRFNGDSRKSREVVEAILALSRQSQENQHEEIEPESAFVSDRRFEDLVLAAELKHNIRAKQYTILTPIQDQAIPAIMAGKDVIGIANTGTGKTAAFLIPLVDKVLRNRKEKVFIVAPTRELALQIDGEMRDFAKATGIRSALLIGGSGLFRQIGELKSNPNFVIGTPGRIVDLIRQRALNLSQFTNVVIDEADRMVDIGFIKDIKYLISLLPSVRQSLFFSATISSGVAEILRTFVRNPVTVSVKRQEAAQTVNQGIIRVDGGKRKIDQLQHLLTQEGFAKVLIFGRTKWGIQRLSEQLIARGFRAGAIHGNKRQAQRQRILEQFKRNEINILLATDVASRGLDIPDISHVINYDVPGSFDDYIHRIGRTGRADKRGVALTFVE